jgi:hypothetical protein
VTPKAILVAFELKVIPVMVRNIFKWFWAKILTKYLTRYSFIGVGSLLLISTVNTLPLIVNAAVSCREIYHAKKLDYMPPLSALEEAQVLQLIASHNGRQLLTNIGRPDLFLWDDFIFMNRFYNSFADRYPIYLKNDWQYFYKIDTSTGTFIRNESGGSKAIRSQLLKKQNHFVRYVSREEKQIWLASHKLLDAPTEENLKSLLILIDSVQNSSQWNQFRPEIDPQLVSEFKNASDKRSPSIQIIEIILNSLGREHFGGNIFFMSMEGERQFSKGRERLEFNIPLEAIHSNWYFGVEDGYAEVIVPQRTNRYIFALNLIPD